MPRKIVIDNSNGEVRAAVIEDGKLADLFIERSRHPSVLGNIYKGKVENVLPGMQAAFVDIGLEKNAFLYVDDAMASLPDMDRPAKNGDDVELPMSRGKSIRELLKPGQEVMVQVTKEAIGTKGARVVTDVTLAGRYVVLIPSVNYVGISRKIMDDSVRNRLRDLAHKAKPRGMGLIVRTVAEEQPEDEVVRDIEFLNRAWKKIRAKAARAKAPYLLHYDADLVYRMARDYFGDDVTEFTVSTAQDYSKVSDLLHIDEGEKDPRIRLYADKKPVFEAYGIEEEIWKATRRKVWLNSGGYLIFDTTEALTVIDVNTGKFTGNKDLEDTAFRNNLEAAGELARQIRLRNIGGILIADFIDMESEEHRRRVLEELEKHLTRDKARTSVLGITKLGLIEMTRKKSQQGLVELTHRVCDVCDGRGKVISEETLALRAERLIKREAAATDMQALLIGLNPYVAGELSQDSSTAIRELEEQTMRDIFIKADPALGRDDVKVIAAGSLEEILSIVHPVKKGDVIQVTVGQPGQDRPLQGIAIYEGFTIYIEDAQDLVDRTVKVKISRVFKGYAKARVEGRHEARTKRAHGEAEYDLPVIEAREPRKRGTDPLLDHAAEIEEEAEEQDERPDEPEAVEAAAAEAAPGGEAKRKRRRRRHRRGSKDRATATAPEPAEAAAQGEGAAVETQERAAEEAAPPVKEPASEATAQASGEAMEASVTATRRRRRRRHRSRRPAQAAAQPTEAGLGESGHPAAVVEQAGQKAQHMDSAHAESEVQASKAAEGEGSQKEASDKAEAEKPKSRPRPRARTTPSGRAGGGEKKAKANEAEVEGVKSEGPGVAQEDAGEEAPETKAEAKPKRKYNRRKKAAMAEAASDAVIDTEGE